MHKSFKRLDTETKMLAKSLEVTFLYIAQECVLVSFLLSSNGKHYYDIVSLFVLCCVMEFNILIAID